MSFRRIDVSGNKEVPFEPQEKPVLRWISIVDLLIDDRYQRPLGPQNWAAIHSIAKNFQWSKFAPIMASSLEGGRFAVIDGQHRAHAAALCGISEIPALVVSLEVEDQARSFSSINGAVVKITPHHIFKAALAAREEWALACDLSVANSGCRLMTYNASTANKKPGEIYSIGLIRSYIAKDNAPAVTTALRALREYDVAGRVPLYSDYILRPWIDAIIATEDHARIDLTAFLKRHDPFQVLARVERIHREERLTTRLSDMKVRAFVVLLRSFERLSEVTECAPAQSGS